MGSHKNNLYQKDEEKKKAAREALDEVSKATKKLLRHLLHIQQNFQITSIFQIQTTQTMIKFFKTMKTLRPIINALFKDVVDPIDWKALANSATVERIDSVTSTNMYAILRTGETDSCFSTLFYYIYGVLFANDYNYASLKTLLNNLGFPSFIMGTVISALDGLKSVVKVALRSVVLATAIFFVMRKKGLID